MSFTDEKCSLCSIRKRYHEVWTYKIPDKLFYFSFPEDPRQFKVWQDKLLLSYPDITLTDSSLLCSLHFRPIEYPGQNLLPTEIPIVQLFEEKVLHRVSPCTVCRELNKHGVRERSKDKYSLFKIDQSRQKMMVEMISIKFQNLPISEITHICSRHFRESDIISGNGKKVLKINALPTLNFSLSALSAAESNDSALWGQDVCFFNTASKMASTFLFSKPKIGLVILMNASQLECAKLQRLQEVNLSLVNEKSLLETSEPKNSESPTTCRICFTNSSTSNNITSVSEFLKSTHLTYRISDTITSFCPGQQFAQTDEFLLSGICQTCRTDLMAALNLRQKCQQSLGRFSRTKCRLCHGTKNVSSLQSSRRSIDMIAGYKVVLKQGKFEVLCETCTSEIAETKRFIVSMRGAINIYRKVFEDSVAQQTFPDWDHTDQSTEESDDDRDQSPLGETKFEPFLEIERIEELPQNSEPGVTTRAKSNVKKPIKKKKKREPKSKSLPKVQVSSKICHICGKVCRRPCELTLHIKERHGPNKMTKCPKCDMTFRYRSNLSRHDKAVHQKLKNFQCTQCGVAYADNWSLKFHVANLHTKLDPYLECQICSCKFNHPMLLQHHEKQHKYAETKRKVTFRPTKKQMTRKQKKPFACVVCALVFASRSNFTQHHQLEHPNNTYWCSQCSKSYTSYNKVQLHFQNKHSKEHKCRFCDYKSFVQGNVTRHENSQHTHRKMFQCDICLKMVTTNYSLITHKRIHTGEKPFECEYCGMRFTDTATIYKHRKRHIQRQDMVMTKVRLTSARSEADAVEEDFIEEWLDPK